MADVCDWLFSLNFGCDDLRRSISTSRGLFFRSKRSGRQCRERCEAGLDSLSWKANLVDLINIPPDAFLIFEKRWM